MEQSENHVYSMGNGRISEGLNGLTKYGSCSSWFHLGCESGRSITVCSSFCNLVRISALSTIRNVKRESMCAVVTELDRTSSKLLDLKSGQVELLSFAYPAASTDIPSASSRSLVLSSDCSWSFVSMS